MRTITALFDTYDHAASAVRSLRDAGIPSADISLVANATGYAADETGAEEGAAAGAGALARMTAIPAGSSGSSSPP